MEPTLMTDDIVIYKTINKNSIISRGQIITFENSQTNGKLYCKRVIGIEGDTVSFSNGKVYVNNRLLDESAYLDLNINTYSSNSYTVPEHCCFVLGDNRENSFDSRFWEYPYVNYDDITSYYVLTIWSNKWLFWNQKS